MYLHKFSLNEVFIKSLKIWKIPIHINKATVTHVLIMQHHYENISFDAIFDSQNF